MIAVGGDGVLGEWAARAGKEIVVGLAVGVALGTAAANLYRWGVGDDEVDQKSLLGVALALAFVTLGSTRLLGGSGAPLLVLTKGPVQQVSVVYVTEALQLGSDSGPTVAQREPHQNTVGSRLEEVDAAGQLASGAAATCLRHGMLSCRGTGIRSKA